MKKFLKDYLWVLVFSPFLIACILILVFTISKMNTDKKYWGCKKECSKMYPFVGIHTEQDFIIKREKCREKCFNRIFLKEN